MQKIEFSIEYSLDNSSSTILWNSICTPLGLSEWFADGVTVSGNEYVFSWDGHEQTAVLQQLRPNSYIRFHWVDDGDLDTFFEFKIVSPEITGGLILVITDYAEPSEVDDLILLWNKQIEELRRKTGM